MKQSLEAKVQRLIDIEDIKILKLRYARFCDDSYNPDGIASCFTEDAVWEGGILGHAEGREAIHRFFTNSSKVVDFATHYTTNPIIEVTGDQAEGTWYLWQPMVMVEGSQAMWLGAHYEEQYVRQDDAWLIQHLKLHIKQFSPFETSFGQALIADLPN